MAKIKIEDIPLAAADAPETDAAAARSEAPAPGGLRRRKTRRAKKAVRGQRARPAAPPTGRRRRGED